MLILQQISLRKLVQDVLDIKNLNKPQKIKIRGSLFYFNKKDHIILECFLKNGFEKKDTNIQLLMPQHVPKT